jgi:hypothetical protein
MTTARRSARRIDFSRERGLVEPETPAPLLSEKTARNPVRNERTELHQVAQGFGPCFPLAK